MRIKTVIFFLVLSFTSLKLSSQNINRPFVSGEKLLYLAHFGWLDAGEASFIIRDTVFENKRLFFAEAKARTVGLADKLFEVRDIYSSFFHPQTSLTHLAIRNINEGKYHYYNEVRYYQSERKVISQKSGEHEVPENIMDMLGAYYFFRQSMINNIKKVGDEVIIDTYFADEIFPLKLRYVGDETVKTKLGKFRCMKFSPVVEPGRIFDSEDDVTIWISKDKNFIPLQIRIDLIIGSIKCDLIDYSGLQYPLEKMD